MPDIIHILQIKASPAKVFEILSTPEGLNRWWTKDCHGRPELGSIYDLDFGPVVWQCQVTDLLQDQELEYTLCKCDEDWLDTQVRFELEANSDGTKLKFKHLGWAHANDHFHGSNHCWGLYLRVLRRYIEFGEEVSYENRLVV